MRKWLNFMVVGTVMCLLLAVGLWFTVENRSASIKTLALTLPPHPDDRMAEQLVAIFGGLTEYSRNMDARAIDDWVRENRTIGDRFDQWKASPASGFRSRRWEQHNRLFSSFEHTEYARFSVLHEAMVFLVGDARVLLGDGQLERGLERLDDAMVLGEQALQQPGFWNIAIVSTLWKSAIPLLLDEVPLSRTEAFIERIPSSERMRDAIIDAIYTEGVSFEIYLDTENAAMHRQVLSEINGDRRRANQFTRELIAYTRGSWQHLVPTNTRVGIFDKLADRWDQHVGLPNHRHLLARGDTGREPRMLVVMLDSLRVQLHLRARGLQSDRSTATAMVDELDLISPVTDTRYRTDDQGRLCAEFEAFWYVFGEDALMPLIAEFAKAKAPKP